MLTASESRTPFGGSNCRADRSFAQRPGVSHRHGPTQTDFSHSGSHPLRNPEAITRKRHCRKGPGVVEKRHEDPCRGSIQPGWPGRSAKRADVIRNGPDWPPRSGAASNAHRSNTASSAFSFSEAKRCIECFRRARTGNNPVGRTGSAFDHTTSCERSRLVRHQA